MRCRGSAIGGNDVCFDYPSFATDQVARVRVAVYDIRGRIVAELTDESFQPGEHSVDWSGQDAAGRTAPSGEYFFVVHVDGKSVTRKALLLR